VKLICGLRARYSYKGLFKNSGILTLPCILIDLLCVFKFNISVLFETNSDFHAYNTRYKNNVTVPAHSSDSLSKSPYYLAATIFDHLPTIIRKIKNITLFRNLLKKMLLEKGIL
jgi:hypothetical protein